MINDYKQTVSTVLVDPQTTAISVEKLRKRTLIIRGQLDRF